jgi:hypothetical protein
MQNSLNINSQRILRVIWLQPTKISQIYVQFQVFMAVTSKSGIKLTLNYSILPLSLMKIDKFVTLVWKFYPSSLKIHIRISLILYVTISELLFFHSWGEVRPSPHTFCGLTVPTVPATDNISMIMGGIITGQGKLEWSDKHLHQNNLDFPGIETGLSQQEASSFVPHWVTK